MLGTGKALVTAVGKNSQAGDIQMLLGGLKGYLLVLIRDFTGGEGQGRSVLQTKLFKLTVWIGVAGVVFALLTTIVLITQYVLEVPGEEVKAKDIINHLMIGITILVVAVPEGLPLAGPSPWPTV